MPAAVLPFQKRASARAAWSLLEIARPGAEPVAFGILAADENGGFAKRLRGREFPGGADLDETETDFLDALAGDLDLKARESGGWALLDSFEDSLSHYIRIGDRTEVAAGTDLQRLAERMFDEHVDRIVRPFATHLPLYGLRAAATKFGEGMESELEDWVRAPARLRLTEGMFVAKVVGRSMEPLIPDGSLCVFRAPVTGSRQGRRLLIEKFGETDFASRYTVKRYARRGQLAGGEEREAPIRLEPLNKDFEAFDLTEDQFRVVAEFVQVLEP